MNGEQALRLVLFECNVRAAIAKRGLNVNGEVQKFIDSEVLRKDEPYVPKLTGKLIQSGTNNTKVGSGQVVYRTPYARKQYYTNAGNGKEGLNKGGQRGKQWFERMKVLHKEQILEGACKIAGAKSKLW